MPTHLITGAGSGIGAALAEVLHARGDDLLLVARSEQRAKELSAQYDGAQTLVADLADVPSLKALDLPDALDSVVHAAGVARRLDIRRLVGDGRPVEDHEVGDGPFTDHAPITEPDPGRRHGRGH